MSTKTPTQGRFAPLNGAPCDVLSRESTIADGRQLWATPANRPHDFPCDFDWKFSKNCNAFGTTEATPVAYVTQVLKTSPWV